MAWVSQRFIEAFARGELTKGGLAEAGWFELGTIAEDGLQLVYRHTVPKYPLCVCGHSHERFNTLAPECLSGCGCMNYEPDEGEY